MSKSSKPIEITEDDIGVEGRYLYQGRPAVCVAILNNLVRQPHRAIFVAQMRDTIEESIWETKMDGSSPYMAIGHNQLVTRVHPKVYVGVKLPPSLSTRDIGKKIPPVSVTYVSKTKADAWDAVNSWGIPGPTHVFEVEVDE